MNIWSEPKLVISVNDVSDSVKCEGILTPTPIMLPNGNVRLFMGVRNHAGISTLAYCDLSSDNWSIKGKKLAGIIDLGKKNKFDSNGIILGDLAFDPLSGNLMLFYVGFSNFPTIKFRAFTGLAISSDFGETFEKISEEPFLGKGIHDNRETIVAVHSAFFQDNNWEILVAIGSSWEIIGEKPFPRYKSYLLTGPDLNSLVLSKNPIIKNPHDVYRLGRPRHFISKSNPEFNSIVATGGKVDGDYRPYVFKKNLAGRYVRVELDDFPVFPGCHSLAMTSSPYPVYLETTEKRVIFFNSENMGTHGVLLTESSINV